MLTGFGIEKFVDYILFASCLFLLFGSVYLSLKTRFVQFRMIPSLCKTFFDSVSLGKEREGERVPPHKALLTAMSTTLGISTIAGPAIAIHLGGPGALIGFLLTSVLGSAATFTEVSLCVKFRSRSNQGGVASGPMGYLKKLLSPRMAKWYAISCCILMTAWSSAQSNQLAAIFDSPLLGDYRIPPIISGILIAGLVFFTLLGGIKRVSDLASKMVPLMFVLFLGSCIWILAANVAKLPDVFSMIIHAAFSPVAMGSGALVGGVVSALRWGIFKGTQMTEAGIGTQTIPHSMTASDDADTQGALSMVSTYTAGIVAFLSGCTILVTETWQDPSLPVGISMIAASFHMYFSNFGIAIIALCAFLFGFGTILGNSYNASQCFAYFADPKKTRHYFAFSSCMIVMGAVLNAALLWSSIDIFLAAMAIPHMFALIRYCRKKEALEGLSAA